MMMVQDDEGDVLTPTPTEPLENLQDDDKSKAERF